MGTRQTIGYAPTKLTVAPGFMFFVGIDKEVGDGSARSIFTIPAGGQPFDPPAVPIQVYAGHPTLPFGLQPDWLSLLGNDTLVFVGNQVFKNTFEIGFIEQIFALNVSGNWSEGPALIGGLNPAALTPMDLNPLGKHLYFSGRNRFGKELWGWQSSEPD